MLNTEVRVRVFQLTIGIAVMTVLVELGLNWGIAWAIAVFIAILSPYFATLCWDVWRSLRDIMRGRDSH